MGLKDTGHPVNIIINSTIQHPGQTKETQEIKAEGRLIEKAGKSYLQYEEMQNDQAIQTIIKMGEEEALIMRKGGVTMRLPLAEGSERLGEYHAGPARLEMLVKTEQLCFTEAQKRIAGDFEVAYELHADGSLLGTYALKITYTEGTK